MSNSVMFSTILSPCVAVIRHSHLSPSSGDFRFRYDGEAKVAEFAWKVRPHSENRICHFSTANKTGITVSDTSPVQYYSITLKWILSHAFGFSHCLSELFNLSLSYSFGYRCCTTTTPQLVVVIHWAPRRLRFVILL